MKIDIKSRLSIICLLETVMSNDQINPDNPPYPRFIQTANGPLVYMRGVGLKRRVRDNMIRVDGIAQYIGREADLKAQDMTAGNDLKASMQRWIDLRLFGGLNTGTGQKEPGPLTVTYPTTLDPVEFIEDTGTSVAGRPRKKVPADQTALDNAVAEGLLDMEEGAGDTEEEAGDTDKLVGRMYSDVRVRYGVYRCTWNFDPSQAVVTGVTAEDLRVFLRALRGCIATSRSALRSDGQWRGLWLIDHGTKRGRATPAAHERTIEVRRTNGQPLGLSPAEKWEDYEVIIHEPVTGCTMYDLLEDPEGLLD